MRVAAASVCLLVVTSCDRLKFAGTCPAGYGHGYCEVAPCCSRGVAVIPGYSLAILRGVGRPPAGRVGDPRSDLVDAPPRAPTADPDCAREPPGGAPAPYRGDGDPGIPSYISYGDKAAIWQGIQVGGRGEMEGHDDIR